MSRPLFCLPIEPLNFLICYYCRKFFTHLFFNRIYENTPNGFWPFPFIINKGYIYPLCQGSCHLQLAAITSGCALVNELIEARDEKILGRIIKRYAGYGLLIIDELGYVPFSKEGAELIFRILTERHERKSVIITTNLGFGDWTQIFGDPNLTAALLDRITHKAHIINCSWESYRLKESLNKRRGP